VNLFYLPFDPRSDLGDLFKIQRHFTWSCHHVGDQVFQANNARVKQVIHTMIERMPEKRECPCGSALQGARL
jgi:uncharacterized protein (DUF2249 family)